MTTFPQTAPATRRSNWLTRSENWLDSKGKAAWIAAVVLGFIVFWPLGLALLAYMIWSRRMFTSPGCTAPSAWTTSGVSMRGTGNSAFDAYKADTLRRLEEEQEKFEAFLERLRDAKDKSEFDQFMSERAGKSEPRAPEA